MRWEVRNDGDLSGMKSSRKVGAIERMEGGWDRLRLFILFLRATSSVMMPYLITTFNLTYFFDRLPMRENFKTGPDSKLYT